MFWSRCTVGAPSSIFLSFFKLAKPPLTLRTCIVNPRARLPQPSQGAHFALILTTGLCYRAIPPHAKLLPKIAAKSSSS